MNVQDREDLKELSKKLDILRDDIHNVHLEVKDLATVASVDEEKIETIKEDLKNTKADHGKRIVVLEKGERKTIVIASLVGAVVTGGGALIIVLLS